MKVSAIVLAAGMSTRMGRNKLLIEWEGTTIIRHVAERCREANLHEVQVVLGHEANLIRAALVGLPCLFAVNEGYREGMGSSIAAGVLAADPNTDGFLIVLGDMPFLTESLIETIVDHGTKDRIVVPRFKERMGNPVLFGSDFRTGLSGLTGDQGARAVVEENADRVRYVDLPDEGPFRDLDTEAAVHLD